LIGRLSTRSESKQRRAGQSTDSRALLLMKVRRAVRPRPLDLAIIAG
jgi:hypothetical protein